MNGNIFNTQPTQQNGFYPYGYQAAMAPTMRPEPPAYMMPQNTAPAFIKGRPVSSLEEARVAQVDLDGSVFIFPDLGNKRIYTKRINADGTATLHTYSLDAAPVEDEIKYATKTELDELKSILDEILNKLKSSASVATTTGTQAKINF